MIIMSNKVKEIKDRIRSLIKSGDLMVYSFILEFIDNKEKPQIEEGLLKKDIDLSKLPGFENYYEIWYSEALLLIKIICPDRLSDFMLLYKDEKRKKLSYSTYTISDALIHLVHKSYNISPISALSKLRQQISIVRGVEKVFDSVIPKMKFEIAAELFDSEINAARALIRAKFYRAAGAMCGVLLEKHFSQVCSEHKIVLKKSNPTIFDFNEVLKNENIIDMPTWRKIQYLADLRNICCHNKDIEPSEEQVNDLLQGTEKLVKSIF